MVSKRQTSVLLATILVSVVLASCTKKSAVEPSERRQATVLMQDGTTASGAVVASSDSEITLAGDDGITRTIPMKQVRSVEYREQAAPQPEAAVRESPPASPASSARPAPVGQRPDQQRQYTPPPRTYDIPAGTQISVLCNETIDSSTAVEGQGFAAEVPNDVLDASGTVAIPRRSTAQLVIVSASRGGQFRGASDLQLDLTSVTVEGRRYQVDAANLQQSGNKGFGANKRTATYTGGGAAIGAIIGAIAGGGKGAAIGAGAGAGAGALTQVLTKGKAIRVPAESVLTFRLDQPLRIVAAD